MIYDSGKAIKLALFGADYSLARLLVCRPEAWVCGGEMSLFVHRVPHSGCSILRATQVRAIDSKGMLNSIDIKHIGLRGGAVEQGDLSLLDDGIVAMDEAGDTGN